MNKNTHIKQQDLSDCGAACLASIAAHYQLQMPISRIRQFAGTNQKGTSVMGLIEAANKLGFQAKAAKGNSSCLTNIPLPAITQVTLNNTMKHFMVLFKIKSDQLILMDPIDGKIHQKKLTDFEKEWTGIILLLLPNEHFVKANLKQSNLARFIELVKPHRSNMIQAIVGAVVYSILGLSASIYIQKIIDLVIPEANTRLLNLLSTGMVILLCLQLFISYFKSQLSIQTGQQIDAKLILGYYKHLMKLPQQFFDSMRVGEIISRINDAVKIRTFINDVAINILVNSLIICFSFVLMFFFYLKLALLLLGIIPIYIAIYWLSNVVNKKWQRKLMEENAELEANLVESINASSTIKKFGIEEFNHLKIENRFIRLLKSIYQSSILSLKIGIGFEFSTRVFSILLLWLGTYSVMTHALSTGELLSFYTLVGYFTGPAASLISANKNIQEAMIAADRLFEILELEVENSTEAKIHLTPSLLGNIEFKNVLFRYGSSSTIFEGLNLTIPLGETTAIVGESGCGKSTLLLLLQNMYPLQDGSIHIGSHDIRQISYSSLREQIAVVPQQIDLFGGSILENIALGEFEPDLNRVIQLSKAVGVHEFVEKLPENYHTILQEKGSNLSGGQKQRIAIARALYRNPSILILDEATSSLDEASAQIVLNLIQEQKQLGKTIILITHQASIARLADKTYTLKNGELLDLKLNA